MSNKKTKNRANSSTNKEAMINDLNRNASTVHRKSSAKGNTSIEPNNIVAKNKKENYEDTTKKYYMIPIILILCIIPFILREKVYHTNLSQFAWFSDNDLFTDIFLYYKQWALVVVAGVMVIVIAYQVYRKKRNIKFSPIFIPMFIYGIMSLLSAVFSKYPLLTFGGSFEQFESVFALIGYCIIAYYVFLFINTEGDMKQFTKYLMITAAIMSILGALQFSGHNPITSNFLYQYIVPAKYQVEGGFTSVFESNRVFLTLFNPNYVGVYVTLLLPLIMVMVFFQKNLKRILISVAIMLGLLICMIGSISLSGYLGIMVAFFCMLLLMWRYLLKRYYITVPVILLAIIALVMLDFTTDHILSNKLKSSVTMEKTVYTLSKMETNDDNISMTYNGNKITLQYSYEEGQTASFVPMDENGQLVVTNYDAATNTLSLNDERFSGISLGVNADNASFFYIQVGDKQWYFTKATEDGTYYHLNRMNKLDKMITPDSAIFTGYESFASGRGYLWSRTIPLLKNYIFLGSGPDTFVTAFPQQDYLYFYNAGYANAIITKPHNMYLQIGVQTGVLSLIAFLVFYAMYFISSIRIYIKGRFSNYYAQIGVAIFIGTIGYMFAGLANDSSITTAPYFWALIGLGIAVNQKAKPLILKEVAELKEAKKLKGTVQE